VDDRSSRPDPDALLARVRAETSERRRGRLKVFFGATAGVGKTYAMLQEARARQREGRDVAVGVVETHGRMETEALVDGLEILPRARLPYRGVELQEFDLDAALARHPQILLLDELAHTNAPGSRHEKRWQDVEELLDAGIDVYTTLNVQHLESQNDVVARITHVRVRETVPDAVLEEADDIELIDLPPEELLERLAEGKVYIAAQAGRAAENFFRKGNLIALRQMALRQVAERVDAQMQVYRRAEGVRETWPVAERILVGIGPAPSSQQLVRATKRMAERLRAEWIAVFVETPETEHWPEADRVRAWETMRLAEALGARTVTISGTNPGAELLAYARTHNVSKIVVGKPTHPRWRDRLFGSKLEEVIRGSEDIDVYVITGEAEATAASGRHRTPPSRSRSHASDYAWGALGVVLATVVALLARPVFEPGILVMAFLLNVVLVAVRLGRGPSILASVLGVAAFDFFAVPPYYTFAVSDTEYFISFLAMLVVVLVISTLTARLRDQAVTFRRREHLAAVLYEMSRDLVRTTSPKEALQTGLQHLGQTFGAEVAAYLPDPFGRLRNAGAGADPGAQDAGVAQWVFDHGQPAGAGTSTFPSGAWLHVPLPSARGAAGVLSLRVGGEARFRDPEQLHLLETFASQIAAAFERTRLSEEARRIRQVEEIDRMKGEFIRVASHELRTPLDALAASLRLLAERATAQLNSEDRALLDEAERNAERLIHLADSLLDLSRLESGGAAMDLRPTDPVPLLRDAVQGRSAEAGARGIELTLEVDGTLPAVRADAGQIMRVLHNLLSNALIFTPTGGHVLVDADAIGEQLQVSVADDGPGVPLEDQERIFDHFVRGRRAGSGGGAGLGLAVAREIILAHGGSIWVDSGPGPGSVFSFTLPLAEAEGANAREAAPPWRS
jgi:two-component system sensor histidine kinase KdpD